MGTIFVLFSSFTKVFCLFSYNLFVFLLLPQTKLSFALIQLIIQTAHSASHVHTIADSVPIGL